MIIAWLRQLHHYLETVPDRLYPFRAEIDGVRKRGRQAYLVAVARAQARYGPGTIGHWLLMYRSVWHILGSVVLVLGATIVSEAMFGTLAGMQVFLLGLIMFFFLQEFYWHPKHYAQGRTKSYIDWLTWVIPMIVLGWLI